MERISEENKDIVADLKKFFRKSDVTAEENGSGVIFIVDSYIIRSEGEDAKCRVALYLQGKAKEVLVEEGCPHLKGYLTGMERKKEIEGASWTSIPISNFWEPQRPAYWFIERNLTKFFVKDKS